MPPLSSLSNLSLTDEQLPSDQDQLDDSFDLSLESHQHSNDDLDLLDDGGDLMEGEDNTQLLGVILPGGKKSSPPFNNNNNNTEQQQQQTTEDNSYSYSYGGTMGTFTPSSHHPFCIPPPTPLSTSTSLPPTSTTSPQTNSNSNQYEPDPEINFNNWSEAQLKRYRELLEERDGLRVMNEGLEGVERDLRGVQGGLERFESTIATSHALLDLYVTLSSQAEHTQALLLDGEWEGVSKDIQILAAQEIEQTRIAQESEAALEREQLERERELERKELELIQQQQLAEEKKKKLISGGSSGGGSGRGGVSSRGRGAVVRGSISSTRGGGSSTRPQPNSSLTSTTSSTTNHSQSQSGIGRGGPPSMRGSGTVTGVRGVRGIRSRVLVRGTGVGSGSGRGGGGGVV